LAAFRKTPTIDALGATSNNLEKHMRRSLAKTRSLTSKDSDTRQCTHPTKVARFPRVRVRLRGQGKSTYLNTRVE